MTNGQANNGLNIIKASAGSGKTRRLTLEYIHLVLSNPLLFKNILAVTFTNKATAELKLRIVDELKKIARGNPEGKMLPDLMQLTGASEQELSESASRVLEKILHEYGHFSVSTIDQFFQGIVRALTRELNLSGGYRVQIDQREIIENAVENFLGDLQNNKSYMKLMLDFVDARMSDDKSWNVQYELNQFTNQLFREHVRFYFVRNKGSLTGQKSPEEVRQLLRSAITKFEKRITAWYEKGRDFIDKTGIEPDDLKGKSRNPFHTALQKVEKKDYGDLPNRLEKLLNVENWIPKTSKKLVLAEPVQNFMSEFTNELETIIKNEYAQYIEAVALFKNIFQHSLASGLMKKVTEYLRDQNLFMLSDAPVLLNLFTDNSDTPFIYEKTGHRYQHYMIDEFQDTSALQWANFKPLIEESVASVGFGNYIVGDVKQAIYRWRNGDWNLLQRKVAEQIPNHNVEPLKENWRSKKNIVDFNSNFFKTLIPSLAPQQPDSYGDILKEIYNDVEQVIPEQVAEARKGGYILLRAIEGEKVDDFKNNALIDLKQQVDKLTQEYQKNGICILVRKNDEVKKVATYLINETKYNIISTGSMTLANSRMLQHIIAAFRYLTDPNNLYLKTLVYLDNFEHDGVSLNDIFLNEGDGLLNPEFRQRQAELANSSSLALIGKLIEIFKLEDKFPNHDAFISRFYNELKKLAGEKGGGLKPVIDWWDREGSELSIEINETDEESITIMTIHKSKGLQFEHVILPFVYGALDKKLDMMWIDGSAFSFDELKGGLFPVTLTQNHIDSPGLNHFYQKEIFELMVDQINTLYVAMTRAKESLTVLFNKNANKSDDIAQWFKNFISIEENEITRNGHFVNEDVFEYGELIKTDNPQHKTKTGINVQLGDIAGVTIKTDHQHILTKPREQLMASKGSLFHRIFENIIVPDDIDQAIDEQINLGFLDSADRQKLFLQIQKWISQPAVAKWFEPGGKVLTEADIIVPKTTSSRPDRLVIKGDSVTVIDYKFGEQHRVEHQKQVKNYCKIIKAMGYIDVKGFVWYPIMNDVLEVDV